MATRVCLSRLFVPTSKDVSASAQVASHQLMLRAGFIRQSAAGVYTLLPFAQRIQTKLERVIDEEMEAIGGNKLSLPTMLSAKAWKKTGRWTTMSGDMFRFKDRKASDFCLAPTHEEEITQLVASEITSYRQLPLRLYQIGRKYRDELRPRSGLLRTREFVMKDMYSFDVDQTAAIASYEAVMDAYRRIFHRIGVTYAIAEADTGSMGGQRSHEFHFFSPAGEDTLLSCPQCGYTANEELAQSVATEKPDAGDALCAVSSTVHYFALDNQPRTMVVVVVPTQRQLNPLKLQRHLKLSDNLHATEAAAFSGVDRVLVVLDATLPETSWPRGGSDVVDHRLAEVSRANICTAVAGDYCQACHASGLPDPPRLVARRAIEVGHTFMLGDTYSTPLAATCRPAPSEPNEIPAPVPVQMGCYGLGVTRMLAAIAQATHDANGLRWPWSIAPYRVCVIPLALTDKHTASDAQLLADAQQLQDRLEAEVPGLRGEVVLDDRRGLLPGWRFKDAELIGYPWCAVLGRGWAQHGQVELQDRWTRQREAATPEALIERLRSAAQIADAPPAL